MFEEVIITGTPKREIALATRLRNRIPNELRTPLTKEEREEDRRIAAAAGDAWKPRVEATGNYNCAGHVWGSRRTCIFDKADWERILRDDGYSMLNRHQPPLPDDLVIYRLPGFGIVHVGKVIGFTGVLVKAPLVLSKWADWAGEYEHKVGDEPFRRNLEGVEVEYWTERFRGATPWE